MYIYIYIYIYIYTYINIYIYIYIYRFNEDDLIGVCAIPFKDIITTLMSLKENGDEPVYSFSNAVHANGEITGQLEGKIRMKTGVIMHLSKNHHHYYYHRCHKY
jgi:hypothetical protein